LLLTISIVNWNTTPLLEALLESISRDAPDFEYEVIVVDNASSDFDAAIMREKFPTVNFVVNAGNDGYAHGNNQALELSTGDFVLLLNPDTEVTEGALNNLVKFMQEHPEAAAAGSKLVRPDGSVDRSLRSFPYPGPIAWEFLRLSRVFPKNRLFSAYRMDYFDYETTMEVDQPMGSCLILSRKAIETIGIMDEQFPIFFNEVDWLYRAKQAGFKVFYTPDAVVIHHGAGSTKQVPKQVMSIESHKSLLKFYEKHFKKSLSPISYYLTVGSIKFSRFLMELGD
jgi:GT2 family glycosyltransferase